MRQKEVRVMAKSLGLIPGRSTKLNLIRSIQVEEGNFPCFATAVELSCDQSECVWRGDCFTAVKKSIKAA